MLAIPDQSYAGISLYLTANSAAAEQVSGKLVGTALSFFNRQFNACLSGFIKYQSCIVIPKLSYRMLPVIKTSHFWFYHRDTNSMRGTVCQ